MKPTPGPWIPKIAGPNYWITDSEDRTVAFIGGKDTIFTQHPNTPHAANAALIALSPEMRDWIIQAIATIDCDDLGPGLTEKQLLSSGRELLSRLSLLSKQTC